MPSVVFTGDIGFDRYMTGRFEDENIISQEIKDFFNGADHVVANVEGAMVNAEDTGEKGIFFHAMDPRAIKFLKLIRADVWSLANNHAMDAKQEGLESTQRIAKENNCQTIGAGLNRELAAKPVIFDEDGGVGIFSCGFDRGCPPATEDRAGCFSWNAFELIEKTAAEIHKTCKHCVLVVHGGEEFGSMPIVYNRERYMKFLSLGVDIVVAHHPHVPQNYELFDNGKAIFYSLGNFIFDTDYQRAQMNTDRGVLLQINFTEDGFTFDALGTKLIRGDERIEKGELPDIFTNIDAKNYEALAPYAAKALLANEKRRKLFMKPEEFGAYDEAKWIEYYTTESRTPWESLDFKVYYEEAQKESNPDVLPKVKEYLKKQM